MLVHLKLVSCALASCVYASCGQISVLLKISPNNLASCVLLVAVTVIFPQGTATCDVYVYSIILILALYQRKLTSIRKLRNLRQTRLRCIEFFKLFFHEIDHALKYGSRKAGKKPCGQMSKSPYYYIGLIK